MRKFCLFVSAIVGMGVAAHALCCDRPSDTYVYYKVGGGVNSTGSDGQGAVAAGLGVRHRGKLGWDVGLAAVQTVDAGNEDTLAILRGLALLYLTPQRPTSFYAGAGLGFGAREIWKRGWYGRSDSELVGLFAEFVVGHEWLFHVPKRALVRGEQGCHYQMVGYPMRLFTEVSVHQPAAVTRTGQYRDMGHEPAVTFEVGIGF